MDINQKLIEFLSLATSPFHAVQAMVARFEMAGFQLLREDEQWSLQAGQRYYLTRNGSSIVAFAYGSELGPEQGLRMAGAHTDSPCLKVKPQPEIHRKGYFQLGVEVYGGALLNPWYDRDLSLSGRVSYRDDKGLLRNGLIDFRKAIATVPSLAIHLDREANDKRSINAQTDIPPIISIVTDEDKIDFRSILLKQLLAEHPTCSAQQILDYDLGFYDIQPPAIIGLNDDFISSARLDNLLSCFVGMEALIDSGTEVSSLLVCNDHEEVGSQSAAGAQGPMLKSVIERLTDSVQDRVRLTDRSLMISIDNAHGVHPNYVQKHDENHGPVLNGGPVIKVNANQRYASNSETMSLLRMLCERESVPVQSFVVRSDMSCGSTIGPMTSAELGVKTLDIGLPSFAMHSIRELAGAEDPAYLYKVIRAFFTWSEMLGAVNRP